MVPRYAIISQLNGAGCFQQLGQISLLALEVRVTANVHLVDVDVGDGALARDLMKSILEIATTVCG